MRRRAALGAFLFLLLAGAVSVRGQFPLSPRMPEGPSFQPEPIYYEAINLPADDPRLSRIDVIFRIDAGFFISVRNLDTSLAGPLVRRGDILVELLDSSGTSAARNIERVLRTAATDQSSPSAPEWIEGMVSFSVAPGRYIIALSVEDGESERKFQEQRKTVVARDFTPGAPVMSGPFILSSADSITIAPANFGGGFRFGKPALGAFILTNLPGNDPLTVSYVMEPLNAPDSKGTLAVADTLRDIHPIRGVELRPVTNSAAPGYEIVRAGGSPSLVMVALPTATLPLGRYNLILNAWNDSIRQSAPAVTDAIWPEMPRSLRDISYAINSLRYLVTEDELDSLDSGNDDAMRLKLFSFWKERDRTPETAFNEVMVEYYSRVDHAAMSFGTLRQPDGSRTDRGYIYIIHGPPTRTQRRLDPEGYREVWYYAGTNKTFVFVDRTRTGDYVLNPNKP